MCTGTAIGGSVLTHRVDASTPHPWEGTVGKPGLALGEPSLHPIDIMGGAAVRKPVYTCLNAGVSRAGSDAAAQSEEPCVGSGQAGPVPSASRGDEAERRGGA